MSAFGDKIRSLRINKGWTIVELAKRVDVGRPAISKIENGHSNPSPETVKILAKTLHIHIDFLLELVLQDIASSYGDYRVRVREK